MKRLLDSTRETVHLNIIDKDQRICIDSLESPSNLKAVMPVGSRSPLYAGATSKCLFAFCPDDFIATYLQTTAFKPFTRWTIKDPQKLKTQLSTIRRQGYAVSLGERNPGIGSLSAPVFGHKKMIAAALSLTLPESRYRDSRHRHFCLKQLLGTAADFSTAVGSRP